MSDTAFFDKHPGYTAALGLAHAEMAILDNLLGQLQAAALGVELHIGQAMYLSSHTAFGRLATMDTTAVAALPAGSLRLERIRGFAKRAREVLLRQHELPVEVWKIFHGEGAPTERAAALTQHARQIRALSGEVRQFLEEKA